MSYDANNLLPNAFQGVGVKIDAFYGERRVPEIRLFFQPLGEIIRHPLQPQSSFDKVVMNRMHADLAQPVDEAGERIWSEVRGQHDQIRGTKEEWLVSGPLRGTRMLMKKVLYDFDHSGAQAGNRGELPDVDTG